MLERVWVKKPGEEDNIKSDVETSSVLGLATDWFRSNARVILQYSVNNSRTTQKISKSELLTFVELGKTIWQNCRLFHFGLYFIS